jgi:glycosyltransferase involved in cell wall biosynthesis
MTSVWVYTVVHNEALMMPYFIRHYATFCSRIIVYDDHSDDGTQAIVTSAGADLREYPGRGLDDLAFVAFANEQYKEARGHADYVIWVDGDEFLYHPDIAARLTELHADGVTLPRTRGFNMLGDHPPTTDGQIYEEITTGFQDDRYSKPVIIDPNLDIAWSAGKHEIQVNGPTSVDHLGDPLKLLHFRYLGRAYHEARSAKNYEQLSDSNKKHHLGWEVMPNWRGAYSTDWYEQRRMTAQEVV